MMNIRKRQRPSTTISSNPQSYPTSTSLPSSSNIDRRIIHSESRFKSKKTTCNSNTLSNNISNKKEIITNEKCTSSPTRRRRCRSFPTISSSNNENSTNTTNDYQLNDHSPPDPAFIQLSKSSPPSIVYTCSTSSSIGVSPVNSEETLSYHNHDSANDYNSNKFQYNQNYTTNTGNTLALDTEYQSKNHSNLHTALERDELSRRIKTENIISQAQRHDIQQSHRYGVSNSPSKVKEHCHIPIQPQFHYPYTPYATTNTTSTTNGGSVKSKSKTTQHYHLDPTPPTYIHSSPTSSIDHHSQNNNNRLATETTTKEEERENIGLSPFSRRNEEDFLYNHDQNGDSSSSYGGVLSYQSTFSQDQESPATATTVTSFKNSSSHLFDQKQEHTFPPATTIGNKLPADEHVNKVSNVPYPPPPPLYNDLNRQWGQSTRLSTTNDTDDKDGSCYQSTIEEYIDSFDSWKSCASDEHYSLSYDDDEEEEHDNLSWYECQDLQLSNQMYIENSYCDRESFDNRSNIPNEDDVSQGLVNSFLDCHSSESTGIDATYKSVASREPLNEMEQNVNTCLSSYRHERNGLLSASKQNVEVAEMNAQTMHHVIQTLSLQDQQQHQHYPSFSSLTSITNNATVNMLSLPSPNKCGENTLAHYASSFGHCSNSITTTEGVEDLNWQPSHESNPKNVDDNHIHYRSTSSCEDSNVQDDLWKESSHEDIKKQNTSTTAATTPTTISTIAKNPSIVSIVSFGSKVSQMPLLPNLYSKNMVADQNSPAIGKLNHGDATRMEERQLYYDKTPFDNIFAADSCSTISEQDHKSNDSLFQDLSRNAAIAESNARSIHEALMQTIHEDTTTDSDDGSSLASHHSQSFYSQSCSVGRKLFSNSVDNSDDQCEGGNASNTNASKHSLRHVSSTNQSMSYDVHDNSQQIESLNTKDWVNTVHDFVYKQSRTIDDIIDPSCHEMKSVVSELICIDNKEETTLNKDSRWFSQMSPFVKDIFYYQPSTEEISRKQPRGYLDTCCVRHKANEELKRRRIHGIVTPRTQPYTSQKIDLEFIAALSPDPPRKASSFRNNRHDSREEMNINVTLRMGSSLLSPQFFTCLKWLLSLAAILLLITKREPLFEKVSLIIIDQERTTRSHIFEYIHFEETQHSMNRFHL